MMIQHRTVHKGTLASLRSGAIYLFLALIVGLALTPQRLLSQTHKTIVDLQSGTLEKLLGADSTTIESLEITSGTLSLEDLKVIPKLKKLRELSLQGTELDASLNGTIPGGVFVEHPTLAKLLFPNNTLILASGACSSMPALTTVVLPKGIKNIEMSCFNSCTNLKEINFPQSLEVIGWSAFQGCVALKEVHLGTALKELRGYAFNACSSIEEVVIDGSLANIGEHAFSSCSALQRLELNGNIKEIRKFAFKDDSALSEIRVNALKAPKVGASAFYHVKENCLVIVPRSSLAKYQKAYGWKSLKLQGSQLNYTFVGNAGDLAQRLVACNLVDSLTLKGVMNASDLEYIKKSLKALSHLNLKEVQMVAGGTFNGKEWKLDDRMPFQALSGMSISSAVLPDALKMVPERCFEGCDKLQQVKIGSQTMGIQAGSFLDCTALKEIVVPDSVKSIGMAAFSGCKALSRVSLGKSMNRIWNFAFWDCSSLAHITVHKDNANFIAQDDILFSKDMQSLLLYPAAKEGVTYQVPQDVKEIARESFSANKLITELSLPEGLESIEIGAFAECSSLRKINIPQSLTTLSDEALKGTAITSIVLEGALESIGASALDSCTMLQKVVLGSNISEIEEFVFAHCPSLSEIHVKSLTPPDVVNAFSNPDGTPNINYNSCVLYVPEKAIDLYKDAEEWSSFTQIKVLSTPTITMTTTANVGNYIMLSVDAEGEPEVEGAELKFGGMAVVKAPQITIRGHVTGLDCSDAQLTELNVSQMPTLTKLWCNNNALTALDTRALADLEMFQCISNQLTELDITANKKLLELDCSENKLTQIDLSSCEKLTLFLAYHNAIGQIDLSHNAELIGIDLSENQLSALSVAANPKLETIYCNGNAIKDGAMKQFVTSLPDRTDREKMCNLFVIDTKNTKEENVIFKKQVQEALGKHWKVLNYSAGDKEGAGIPYEGSEEPTSYPESIVLKTTSEEVSLTIGAPSGQVYVNWGDGEWSQATVSEYGAIVKGTRRGDQVVISGADITRFKCPNSDITELLLNEVPELQVLHCYSNALSRIDLSKTPQLKELYLQDNKLRQVDLTMLSHLSDLNASNNELSTISLEGNKELVSLSLLGNKLSSVDLSSCPNLEDVSLGYNQLSALDIRSNPKLYWIIIYKNNFSQEAVKSLFESLPTRPDKDGQIKILASRDDEVPEGNKFNSADIVIATQKGWRVMDGTGEIPSGLSTLSREGEAVQLYKSESGLTVMAPFPCLIYSIEGVCLGQTKVPEDQLTRDEYPSVLLLKTPQGAVHKLLL